jgi:protein O-mannosyl-transferase
VADETQSESGGRRPALVGGALVALTLAVFGHACANEFVNYDDPQYVTDNPHVRAGLSGAGVRWAFRATEALNWHPLTWLSLQLDHDLFGPRPWGYHLTNVLLHAANALLLFLVLHGLTGAVWRSAAVAGLFALHPLHVESVAWVSERKDVLSTFFGLLAVAAYLPYVRRPGLLRYLPVFLALALSLLAKPMLVTLPFVLLLLDYWPLGRLRLWGASPPAPAPLALVLGEKVPLLALAAASCVVTVYAQSKGGVVESLEAFPLGLRVGNAVVSYVRYLGLALWPVGLAAYYPHPRAALPAWQVAGAAALLAAVTALALVSARRRPYLAVGWLWYLGTLVPVIGLVQVGHQALADRYTYVPLVGVFIVVVWGLADLLGGQPGPRKLLAPAAAAALLACAALTWRQVTVWHDGRSLWEHTVRVTADNYVAEDNLARACLGGKGTLADAEAHLRAAVRINPDYAEGHTRLGTVLGRQGRNEEAVACFRRAVELRPGQAEAHAHLAVALARAGKLEEAITQMQEAARLAPGVAEVRYRLAFALAQAGRLDEAVAACRECVRLEPYNPQYRLALAGLLRQHGDAAAAEAERQEAERLRFGFP